MKQQQHELSQGDILELMLKSRDCLPLSPESWLLSIMFILILYVTQTLQSCNTQISHLPLVFFFFFFSRLQETNGFEPSGAQICLSVRLQ